MACSCTVGVFLAQVIRPWFICGSLHPHCHFWGPLASLGYPLRLDLKQLQPSFCSCVTHFQSIKTQAVELWPTQPHSSGSLSKQGVPQFPALKSLRLQSVVFPKCKGYLSALCGVSLKPTLFRLEVKKVAHPIPHIQCRKIRKYR